MDHIQTTASATIHARRPPDSARSAREPAIMSAVYVLAKEPPRTVPALVRQLLLQLDGVRDLATACRDARISEARGVAVVRKLTRLGVLRPAPLRPSRSHATAFEEGKTLRDLPSLRGPSGFSAEEEAFFASEVEPLEHWADARPGLGERLSSWISELVLREAWR